MDDIIVREYKVSDYLQVRGWHIAQKAPFPERAALPDLGFIVEDTAAGFFYETDGDFCLLENYVSNPSADPEKRDYALDLITRLFLHHARERKFRKAVAITAHPRIYERAVRNGFRALEEKFFILTHDLGEE